METAGLHIDASRSGEALSLRRKGDTVSRMGKYDPLGGHLRRQHTDRLEMSFVEVERVLGAMLPNSAQRPQWWANEKSLSHVQCRAWLDAGFNAFLVAGAEKVRFERRTRR